MDAWFKTFTGGKELSPLQADELNDRGFVVLAKTVPVKQIDGFTRAFDAAVAAAVEDDVRVGSTTTRVTDFVNRGAEFDWLYVFPPLLDACCRIINRPFKLSSMHARTLRAGSEAQELHVDVERGSPDWPLAGFILMVDDFRPDNGATRFVPGSHRLPTEDILPPDDNEIQACGTAGSLIVFDGSVRHGHSANPSTRPRRSLQGAFVPRDGHAATDFARRMRPETRRRLTPLAGYLLGL